MNLEHPAHREVKVEQRHRDAARDIYVQIVTNPSLAEVDKEDEIAFEVARFEASLTTPPDQPRIGDALLNPLYADMLTRPEVYGDLHATHIGDETLRQALWSALRFAGSRSAITAEQEKAILATWDARAAIAAMPKEDIWEEAARIAADYETQLSAPLASESRAEAGNRQCISGVVG